MKYLILLFTSLYSSYFSQNIPDQYEIAPPLFTEQKTTDTYIQCPTAWSKYKTHN